MAVNGWVETDSKDNAAATATRAAESGRTHVIFSVTASYSGTAANKLVQIKDNTTVIWEAYVSDNGGSFTFPEGISASEGNKVDVVLAASGTGGTLGKINVHGKTV